MILKFAAPISGARGTLGGIVFSANKAGPYAKQWAPPSQPRTTNQTAQRTQLSKIPALWAALSSAQKTAWDTFAALPAQDLTNSLGETYSLSGYGWFTKCNVRLLVIGRATIQAVPVTARPAAPSFIEFHITPPGANPNLAASATASASSETPVVGLASFAFDQSSPLNATQWRALALIPQWLQGILLGGTVVARRYLLASATGSQRTPITWTFEGWNGAGWDILDTQTNVTGWAGLELDFSFLNTTSYVQYRIDITDSSNPATFAWLGELEIYEDALGASHISYDPGEFAANQDLVLFLTEKTTDARQVAYSGFLSTVQTQAPPMATLPIQTEIEAIFGTISSGHGWFAQLYKQTNEGLRSAPATLSTVSV